MSKQTQPIHTPPEKTMLSAHIWGIVKNACCTFALSLGLLILINLIMTGSMDQVYIFVDSIFLLFVFALCVALARFIRKAKAKTVPAWLKYVSHPLLCLGGLFLAYLPYMRRNHYPAGTVMVHLLAFVVAYGLVMIGVYLVSLLFKRKASKEDHASASTDTYQPVFQKKDNRH